MDCTDCNVAVCPPGELPMMLDADERRLIRTLRQYPSDHPARHLEQAVRKRLPPGPPLRLVRE